MRTTKDEQHRIPPVWRAVALTGSLALALLAAPAAATAAPLPAEDGDACSVDSAEMRWGVKESFRSYISGSIANGEWIVSDDMRYETPEFIWSQSDGSVDSSLDSGTISFSGAVHFTGHGGALQFDLSDPEIIFDGQSTAYLGLVIGATDEGADAEVQAEAVRVAKMDLSGALTANGTELSIEGAIPVLTSEGAATFNGEYGDYVAGEELDPITVTATVNGCELGEAAPVVTDGDEPEVTAEAPTEEAVPAATEQQIPWVPIIIGGVAVLVIGVTVGMLIAGRKKPAAEGPSEGAQQDPSQPAGE